VTAPRLGIALPPEGPLDELVALAVEAEQLGCDTVWVNDDRLQKDVFTVLAAIALRTRDLRLGPGVTNPYSRHPALLATAIATLDELSGERAMLGLGAGGTNHAPLGIERRAPALALREAIAIVRGLLAGQVVTVEGRVLHAHAAQLDFAPPRANVPLYVGTRGPKVLEVAGELADGVIVGNVASVEGWTYALQHIDAGCRRAGRDPDELALSAWVACSVGHDAAAAIDAVRPLVATSLVTSRPILADLGVAMPPGFARGMETNGWSLSRQSVARAASDVPVELVRRFAIAGTVADCRAQVEALLQGVPRITELAIIPFPGSGQRALDVVHGFCTEVMGATVDA
jgi:5,10-methylenetetrahydromethanopterin reductase